MNMPEIIPNQTFKHEAKTYEEGKPYEVSEGEAYYFQRAGWVGPKTAVSESVTLSIDDSHLGQTAEVK